MLDERNTIFSLTVRGYGCADIPRVSGLILRFVPIATDMIGAWGRFVEVLAVDEAAPDFVRAKLGTHSATHT